jgi:SH3-like domain-containing protein
MIKKIIFLSIIMVFGLTSNSFSLCVDKSQANLRSGPGAQYNLTWKIFKYMPIKKVSSKKVKNSAWYKVSDIDGDTHWISSRLVTSKYKCAAVKKDNVSVRKKPNDKSQKALISPAQKYYSFKVLKTQKNWIKVTDENNNSGWISRKMLWIQ